jgi:hypothetical protein
MVLGKFDAGIDAGIADIRKDETPSALSYLQSIYRDPLQPDGVRMRAASLALPYEAPRLAVTAFVRDQHTFAIALDRAIARSLAGKVLEGENIEVQD